MEEPQAINSFEYFFRIDDGHGHESGQVYIPQRIAEDVMKLWKEVARLNQLSEVDTTRLSLIRWDTDTGDKSPVKVLEL